MTRKRRSLTAKENLTCSMPCWYNWALNVRELNLTKVHFFVSVPAVVSIRAEAVEGQSLWRAKEIVDKKTDIVNGLNPGVSVGRIV